MINMEDFQEVKMCIKMGMNNSQIARKLGLDRGTVRKYRLCDTPPKYPQRVRPTRKNPCEPFLGAVWNLMVKAPSIASQTVYKHLKEQGYSGSSRTVQRVVSKNRMLLQKNESIWRL